MSKIQGARNNGAANQVGHGHGNGHRNAYAHGYRGKHRGDEIGVNVEGVERNGRVISETHDTLVVVVGDEVYIINKSNGRSRWNRRATESEIKVAQQMQIAQQQQQQEVKAQEQRSQAVTDNIKVDNRKYEAKILERKYEANVAERKKEARLDEAEALERGTTKKISPNVVRQEQNKSMAAVFQVDDPEMPHKSMSVSEIILTKNQSERLKRNK